MEECSKRRKGKRKKSSYSYSYSYSYSNGRGKSSYSNSSNSSSNSSSNNSKSEIMMVKKGPWKAEEDQVLLNHVNKYGPRDWSSIRSKGLLLRTGKSCRLRWVNKLRPNLKTGCKFTAEEEKIVIELQAEIGNKWATIATHLEGRTDNDVKNFWSSRQKRLARLLHSQSQSQSPPLKKLKSSSAPPTSDHCAHFHQVPKNSSIKGETSSKVQTLNSSSHSSGNTETDSMKIVPYTGSVASYYPSFEANNTAIIEPLPLNTCWNYMEDNFRFPFPPETQDLIGRLDPGYLSPFENYMGGNAIIDDMAVKHENGNLTKPDSFFDDFPLDMFDQIDPLPSPSNW